MVAYYAAVMCAMVALKMAMSMGLTSTADAPNERKVNNNNNNNNNKRNHVQASKQAYEGLKHQNIRDTH